MPINENDSNSSLFNHLDFFYVELYLLYFLKKKSICYIYKRGYKRLHAYPSQIHWKFGTSITAKN